MTYEQKRARMEASQNIHEQMYFEARPMVESRENRRVFCSGFERGWHALQCDYEQLERKLKALEEKLRPDTVAAAEVSPDATEGTPEGEAKEAANAGTP